MKKTICLSIALLAFASFFRTGDCTITGWTPALTSGALAQTITIQDGATAITGSSYVATSGDSSLSGYTISQTPTTGATFAISAAGVLSISAGALDLATANVYVLTIVATDGGGSDTAVVTITFNDQPTFTPSHSGHCIPDGSAVGTTVTTLSVSDVFGTLSAGYTFDSGNTNTDFEVTNEGVLKTLNVMAVLTTPGYTLAIKRDDGTLTSTTTVAIAVLDSCCSGGAGIIASVLTLLVALIVSMH